MAIRQEKAWDTAMLGYDDILKGIVGQYRNADILELGAGRRPSFPLSAFPSGVQSYTVNDISEDELALLPDGYDRACFDVSGDASRFGDKFDVVFSRFLAEHVPDGAAMHRNVFDVLKPGGTAFHLIPTLYAMPFVLNKYFPEFLSHAILRTFAPEQSFTKKFPARYSLCYSNPRKMTSVLRHMGYLDVDFKNFYGHFYYNKIPGLKQAHARFSEMAAENNWTVFASYAYIRARK